jgi:AraC-like DNA-binding protein
MAENRNSFYRPGIFILTGTSKSHAADEYVREHVLCFVISGEMRYTEAATDTIAKAGEIILFRRNLLVKCEKRPARDGQPYKILYFILEKEFMLHYALRNELAIKTTNVTCQPVLLQQDAKMKHWLFDFAEQGKVNLQTFMQRNYMFNVPMTKFAELTGRSLSTFQRDFKKSMGTNAASWLLKRRLQATYEAITTKGNMPVDIYLDLGFEDIAHFSRSFKREFGVNPSQVKKAGSLNK